MIPRPCSATLAAAALFAVLAGCATGTITHHEGSDDAGGPIVGGVDAGAPGGGGGGDGGDNDAGPAVTSVDAATTSTCAGDVPEPPAPSTGPTALTMPQTVAVLATSGDDAPGAALPLLADAHDPPEAGLTPAVHVSTPAGNCPRLMHLFSPAVAIPLSGTVREIEASFDGAPLQVIGRGTSELTEEAHSWGEDVPFFHPLFTLDGVAPGTGTLVVNGYDGGHALVGSQTIPDVQVLAAPPPVAACQFDTVAHPRIWLTPARLATARGRDRATDPAAMRFWGSGGVGWFLDHDPPGTDVTACGFQSSVWDPQSYIPALALCAQVDRGTDDATATKCATAAKALAMDLVTKYETHATSCEGSSTRYTFGHDTGYAIRFDLMYLLVAFDWLYDDLSADDRARIVTLANAWIDWYHGAPGYAETLPWENYYAGYLQGLLLTVVATAGENPHVTDELTLLNQKLWWELPFMEQRLCGGDWPEGWNYGPLSVQELMLFFQTLKDYGSDWGGDFDWAEAEPAWLTYQMTPDFAKLIPFGGNAGSAPSKTSAALLAVLSSTAAQRGLAARLYTQALAAPVNDITGARGDTAYELIFADGSAPADVSALPRSTMAGGTGRWISRSSMSDPAATTVTTENMSYVHDHFGYANGDVRLYAGSTCLVCPSAYSPDASGGFDGEGLTPDFSTYLVNGGGQHDHGRNDQYLFQLEHDAWSAVGMRFESAYATDRYDEGIVDPARPLDYLIREVVHVRPGTLVVRDLHRRRHASDTLTARWHLGPTAAPTSEVNGYGVGPLHVGFFVNGVSVTPSFATDTPPGTSGGVGTLMAETFPSSTMNVEVVHVFSEVDTAVSYAGGVLRLSSGTCVTFAGGTVDVGTCTSGHDR